MSSDWKAAKRPQCTSRRANQSVCVRNFRAGPYAIDAPCPACPRPRGGRRVTRVVDAAIAVTALSICTQARLARLPRGARGARGRETGPDPTPAVRVSPRRLAVGGFFVLLGVWSLGWRVIRTVGSKIATVDFHTAWCIEFGSTLSVVIT